MKQRVLIVTDEMEVGGSQRQIVRLIKNLDKTRYAVDLAYFVNDSYLLDEVRPYCDNIWFLNKRKSIDLGFFWRLLKLVGRRDLAIVHCFAFSAEAWVLLAKLASLSPAKLISSIRGRYEWYSKKHWLIKSCVSRMSRRVVSNSWSGAEYALQNMPSVAPDKVAVVYNGIEAEEFTTSPGENSPLPHLQRYILFVGRLVDHKNLPCLLRAMAALKQYQIPLVLVGEGPLKAALEQQAQALQIEVIFLGERNDVYALMQASSLVVLPSFREGVSNTVIEAMLNHKAVVASRVGGTPEIISDGEDGLLFESDNSDELAAKIALLLDDDAMRLTIGQKAKQKILDRFTIKKMVSETEAIYQQVCTQKE